MSINQKNPQVVCHGHSGILSLEHRSRETHAIFFCFTMELFLSLAIVKNNRAIAGNLRNLTVGCATKRDWQFNKEKRERDCQRELCQNHVTVLTEIKDLNMWKDILCSWFARFN